jgi:hypothetical protein
MLKSSKYNILYKDNGYGAFANLTTILDWLWAKRYFDFTFDIRWTASRPFSSNKQINIAEYFFSYQNQNLDKYDITTNCWIGHSILEDKKELSQKLFSTLHTILSQKLSFYHNYDGYFVTKPEIYFEKDFQTLRNEWNGTFNQFMNIKNLKVLKKDQIKKKRTLGVQIRTPQHFYIDNNINDFYRIIFKEIITEFNTGFDQIYLATDCMEFFEYLYDTIDIDKIVNIDYRRITGNLDWKDKSINKLEECHNAFCDAINLSYCDKLLCATSNIVFFSLIFNPQLKFEFFNYLRDKRGR